MEFGLCDATRKTLLPLRVRFSAAVSQRRSAAELAVRSAEANRTERLGRHVRCQCASHAIAPAAIKLPAHFSLADKVASPSIRAQSILRDSVAARSGSRNTWLSANRPFSVKLREKLSAFRRTNCFASVVSALLNCLPK